MPSIMEHFEEDASTPTPPESPATLPFPPVTREHILHCSYHFWHPKYRTITPKARLIPLSQPFVDYLRSDGIILPSDDAEETRTEWSDTDSGIFSASDNHDSDDDQQQDVSAPWRDVHNAIRSTIDELGGKVVPKLNWSAPKDATWMNANTMECRNPNDVYLLLKSSDFITHDLEHAFDDTVSSVDNNQIPQTSIPYHLVLRKAVKQWNPSVEFRCFVRSRRLICICQRDLNHYDFLSKMAPRLQSLIQEFFDVRLSDTFPDDNFVFDVYIPPPHDRVWLVDFNPWAPRTDPLLFGWLEILQMPEPARSGDLDNETEQFVRLSLRPSNGQSPDNESIQQTPGMQESFDSDSESADEEIWLPELRLVGKNDPEAFGFGMNAPQYSAHKLPKDVVDASQSGAGLREFARDWQNILQKRQSEDALSESSGTE